MVSVRYFALSLIIFLIAGFLVYKGLEKTDADDIEDIQKAMGGGSFTKVEKFSEGEANTVHFQGLSIPVSFNGIDYACKGDMKAETLDSKSAKEIMKYRYDALIYLSKTLPDYVAGRIELSEAADKVGAEYGIVREVKEPGVFTFINFGCTELP
ncbi:hypothetical protein [Limisalsivibrio acetivorans]|uniref:hypothetical protein n=1 Tax=Limisalsivibrio acetivorans TaxID=1304888 RepID=UPI0003B3D205|nr:hypothetical protein [Limisalsivibrio acetivorans]